MKTAAVKTTDAADLAHRMRADVAVQVWNVLDDEWFNGELIPGSKRVPLSGLERAVRESSLASSAAVVVYCAGPACPFSRAAAEKLESLGYSNVLAFEGGLEEWKKAGHGVMGTAERG